MNWYKTSQQKTSAKPDFITTPEEIELAKNFTEALVLFRFKNGWTIQRVEKDLDAGIENNCIPTNYSPRDKKNQKYLYSLRNEYNVPRANFIGQTDKKNPAFFGILEVNYQNVSGQKNNNESYSSALLKQFFDYLKTLGMELKWIENEQYAQDTIEKYERYGKDPITNLANGIIARMAIAPVIRNYGGSSESYAKALKDAYATDHPIEDIYAYAVVKKEDHLLENALQNLSEWADEEFYSSDEFKKDLPELPPVPEYPTKEMFTKKYEPTPDQKEFQTKDFQKSKVPYFDEVAYNKAMEEYQNAEDERSELEDELRDESKSWQFLNECYRKLPKI